MSCRQRSLTEAPNGQKYIPWCLQAFVLENSLRALWVPFWRQLPGQVRGGREQEKKGCPSPTATGEGSAGRREAERGGGASDSLLFPGLGAWSLGSGQIAVPKEDGEILVPPPNPS